MNAESDNISESATFNGEENTLSPTGKPQHKGKDREEDARSPTRKPQHKGEDREPLQMADTLNENMPVGTVTLPKPTNQQNPMSNGMSDTSSNETTNDDTDTTLLHPRVPLSRTHTRPLSAMKHSHTLPFFLLCPCFSVQRIFLRLFRPAVRPPGREPSWALLGPLGPCRGPFWAL